jgi:hypothetical protein
MTGSKRCSGLVIASGASSVNGRSAVWNVIVHEYFVGIPAGKPSGSTPASPSRCEPAWNADLSANRAGFRFLDLRFSGQPCYNKVMRKVLILMALLPGLAFADSVGGPSSNSGLQTASPQNGAAGLNYFQPAPNASEQNLAAPATSPANALQGSVPSSTDQLVVEADGAPQSLSDNGTSNTIWIVFLSLAAVVFLAAAAAIWQLTKPRVLVAPETDINAETDPSASEPEVDTELKGDE